jgi:GNAT superfamily N-acetyltransferase
VNTAEVLQLFDREVRSESSVTLPFRAERNGSVVRMVGPGERCVIYSRLAPEEVAANVAREVGDASAAAVGLEWKVYAHDPEVGLPERLRSAGFRPQPLEVLMVRSLRDPLPAPALPAGVRVERVTDGDGFSDVVAVERSAFGREDSHSESQRSRLGDAAVEWFVAYVGSEPSAAGRLELERGGSFAGLWGGGTVPSARHRGLYRALVAARARHAREAGFRYLYVEALDDTSRPILERLGFARLSTVVGWTRTPGTPPP